jgi:hypothetical protein
MITLRVILMILGLVCLVMSALGVTTSRVNLQSLGLSLWLLGILVG